MYYTYLLYIYIYIYILHELISTVIFNNVSHQELTEECRLIMNFFLPLRILFTALELNFLRFLVAVSHFVP